jgi:putative FmdB family regulatory protein
MPLYEYKCQSCGKTFEVIQKFSDDPLKTHPECGGTVEKLFSAPAFHLKGTGWYATDYGKGGVKPGKSDDSKESKSESKSDKGDSESSKVEAKTESNAPAADSKSAATSESKPATPKPSTPKPSTAA